MAMKHGNGDVLKLLYDYEEGVRNETEKRQI